MPPKKSYLPLVITLIFIVFVVWQQTRDDPLLTEVDKQFTHIILDTQIPVQENGFIAMTGFSSLQRKDMIKRGDEAIRDINERVKKDPLALLVRLNSPKDIEIKDLYKFPCEIGFINAACMQTLIEQTDSINQTISTFAPLINNYYYLQRYSKFAHIAPPQMNGSPPYLYVLSVSQLLTAKAVLDIEDDRIDEGMKFILDDIRFYRHLLSSKQHTLEETNLAVTALTYHYMVLDYLLNTGFDLKAYTSSIKELSTPLSDEQRNLVWALEHERQSQLVTQAALGHEFFYTGDSPVGGCLNNSCSFSRMFSRFIYKFHGTLNAIYLDWQPILNFALKNPTFHKDYVEQLRQVKDVEITRHQLSSSRLYDRYGLFFLRNYTGERQKNNIYNAEGYTHWFVKLYVLNEQMLVLNKTLTTY